MRPVSNARPVLRLLTTPLEGEAPASLVSFCSHCGIRPGANRSASNSRVCDSCGLGLILESSSEIAPQRDDAFLVLDQALAVCAVSRAAERLLGTSEPDAVNRHLSDLLMPADAEQGNGTSLSVAVAWAARGDGTIRTAVVRPANTFGIRLTARIGSCGPRHAALLVLQ